MAKNSALGGNRVKSLPPGAQPGAPSYMPTYKYSGINSGIGGGGFDGMGAGGLYGAGEQSLQGAQGSVGSSHGQNNNNADYRLPVIQSR